MYKKILTISLLSILLIFIFTIDVSASSDFNFTFKDKGLDLPDINISNLEFEPKYFSLFRNASTGNKYFCLSEYPMDNITNYVPTSNSYVFTVQEGLYYRLVLKPDSTSWEFNKSGSAPNSFSCPKEEFLYSNYDVYYNGELLVESDEKTPSEDVEIPPSEDVEEPEIQYYSFKGFDDIEYKLPALPDGILDYKHFIIVKDVSSNCFNLFGFNDSLKITHDDTFDNFDFDDSTTGKLFVYDLNSWIEHNVQKKYGFLKGSKVINSCMDLLQYEEDFNNPEGFFYKPLPLETQGTLAPIIHKVETKGTMKEIIQILPLILVVVVSLVGLRKALKMLSTQFHRS